MTRHRGKTGALEGVADLVLLLHHPEADGSPGGPGLMEVIVAKQRNGPAGRVESLALQPAARPAGDVNPWQS